MIRSIMHWWGMMSLSGHLYLLCHPPLGQSNSFCSLDTVGNGDTDTPFLSGVTAACGVHQEGLEELSRRAFSGWAMECWVLRPTSVVVVLFCVLTNMPLQGENKWISHRKALFRDHTWHALNSPLTLLGFFVFTEHSAAAIMQCGVYFLPCFCYDISHFTRVPILVFSDCSVFLLLLSKL